MDPFIQVLTRRRWVVLGTTLVALAIAVALSAFQTTQYQAGATLRIATPPSPDGVVRADDIAFADRLSNTYRLLLGTEPVRAELAERLGPGTVPDADVRLPPNSELFEIRVTDPDPARAAAAANALSDILIERAGPTGGVTVVEAARPPSDPASPDWALNLALGGILGLLGGVALAVLLERRDTRLHGAEDIEAATRTDVLAEIPELGAQAALYNTGSRQEEAFRGLRTAVLALARARGPGAILVTGTRPGPEVAAVAANLAEALSVAGLRVVAVDADLRDPRLHEAFGVTPQEGLGDVLTGGTAWRTALVMAGPAHADLLAAGAPVHNPGRLLASPRLGALLADIRMEYDVVILAAPPLIGVSDAELLADVVDGVLLVLLRGLVREEEAQRAARRLGLLSASLLGVVVADPSRRPGRRRVTVPLGGR